MTTKDFLVCILAVILFWVGLHLGMTYYNYYTRLFFLGLGFGGIALIGYGLWHSMKGLHNDH